MTNKPDIRKEHTPQLKTAHYVWMFGVAWTVVFAVSLIGNIKHIQHKTQVIAYGEAVAYFNKDQAFRFWAAQHGGIYVPATEKTPPIPYLAHIPERDITTPSGRQLTLINPAYMIRRLSEDFSQMYGIKSHITSLKPLRSGNEPDTWERDALMAFEQGVKEVVRVSPVHGKSHLRLMRPMFTTAACLKCHGNQGYREGDLRGGVSVSVPLTQLLALEKTSVREIALVHVFLWMLGLFGIGFAWSRVIKSDRIRNQALSALHLSHDNLEHEVALRTKELGEKNKALKQARKILETRIDVQTGELNQTQIQLFQTSKLATLGEMATGIAHEINQPLSGIALVAKTFQKLMDRKQLSHEEIESGLKDITLSVKRISKIIDHVRAFARQDTVEFSLVDIGTTVQSALDLLQTQLKLRGIGVDLSIAADLPQVLGEPYQLEQVWINIIGNARDALDEKARRLGGNQAQDMDYRKMLRITANSDPQADIPAIEVCFADNGIGLNPEEKEKIFVPFFTTKEMGKGTGLGMSICHGIIQTHKGTITADSEVNQGAAIRVRLPAAS